MKNVFHKSAKPKSSGEVVREAWKLLVALNGGLLRGSERQEKMEELSNRMRELRFILYGNVDSDPVDSDCGQVTQEFFKEDTLRLLISFLPQMSLEARKDATFVVANLQRQRVQCRLVASTYLEANLDLIDSLVTGYENPEIALHYGGILRECIRHQVVARHVLESELTKKFFNYVQLPNFTIASDAMATFRELLTRHKSTVDEFLSLSYEWFFRDYNSKLLELGDYVTKRQALVLLGDILLDRSNSSTMERYVSSMDNLKLFMNLLRDPSKRIQMCSFPVFKLFVADENKQPEILNILFANKYKLLKLLAGLHVDTDDEQFEEDKTLVSQEIARLEAPVSPF